MDVAKTTAETAVVEGICSRFGLTPEEARALRTWYAPENSVGRAVYDRLMAEYKTADALASMGEEPDVETPSPGLLLCEVDAVSLVEGLWIDGPGMDDPDAWWREVQSDGG